MENDLCKKKTTAPDTSVGADDGQPLHNSTENSISAFEEEINGDFQNSSESLDEIYRRMQRLTDPHYLHTISMTELYQTAYQSRPPIIDGLLYAGAYILAGAPKIGKSFLVAQIAYHVSTGEALWGYEVYPGTVLYSCEISAASRSSAPKMVWVLQGRVNGSENAIWKYHNSQLASTYRPITSFGIVSINTAVEIRQRLWNEIRSSISLLQ